MERSVSDSWRDAIDVSQRWWIVSLLDQKGYFSEILTCIKQKPLNGNVSSQSRSNGKYMSESDRCPLCERGKEQSSEFCDLHRSALEKIESAYSAWNKGYGHLTRQTYYDKLDGLNETGRAVKEIIQYFKNKERVD